MHLRVQKLHLDQDIQFTNVTARKKNRYESLELKNRVLFARKRRTKINKISKTSYELPPIPLLPISLSLLPQLISRASLSICLCSSNTWLSIRISYGIGGTNVSRKTLLLARCNAISQRLMYLPGLVLLRTISPSLADYIANRLQPNRVQKPVLGLRLNSSLPPFLP